jgi:glycosyltransferase involved in cell wall biosynthesis
MQKYLVIDACQFSANYNYCLLDALAKRGLSVVYATTEFAHGYMPDPERVEVRRCFFLLARLAGRVSSWRLVRRFLRAVEYPVDWIWLLVYILVKRIKVVHFMWAVSPWLDYRVMRLLRVVGCKVVYTAHNPFPHEQKEGDARKYSKIYLTADRIITLTQYSKNEIIRHCGVGSDKISMIPHGDYSPIFGRYVINESLASAVRQKAAGRKIIAFLGHIRPYKGVEFFIDAFALIERRLPRPFFLIAGSLLVGNKKQLELRLTQGCSPDSLWADIRFLPVEDLKAYLSVIDVLVQPYVCASQSGNTAMAYAAGVPVVSTNVGGLAEMTEDGQTGYIIPPANPEAIAEAVAKCFEGDNYVRLSRNARRVADERFGWGAIADQTAQVYRIAAETTSKPGNSIVNLMV